MHVPKDAMLLRVFIGKDRRYRSHPLHELIILKAREQHLAGATVLHGRMASGIRGGSTPRRFYASWRTFLLSSKSSTAKQRSVNSCLYWMG